MIEKITVKTPSMSMKSLTGLVRLKKKNGGEKNFRPYPLPAPRHYLGTF